MGGFLLYFQKGCFLMSKVCCMCTKNCVTLIYLKGKTYCGDLCLEFDHGDDFDV